MKPVLKYELPRKKEATYWRPWGGIQTQEALEEEAERIREELEHLRSEADFPLKILPLSLAGNVNDIKDIGSSDVYLIYGAGGYSTDILDYLASRKPSIIFVRHRSGPLYLWYEVVHAMFLRKNTDTFRQESVDYDDVVVDDYAEILWRLRALHGLKNTLDRRVVSVGESSGWGIGQKAVLLAQLRWNLDIKTVSYDELKERLEQARHEESLGRAERQADEYLRQEGVTLQTERGFVVNAFLLYQVFKDLLKGHEAETITVSQCASTILPIAETTPCLTLSLLNDEGYQAFCEADFVVIPSGILLNCISGRPVFLNDPTYPHDGVVTLAHCTAPRKMDGENHERAEVSTEFESDYGAAPGVKFRKGQEVTVVIPDFEEEVWVGFKGRILESPSYSICRSQVDIQIEGDWRKLLREMRGFHWMMVYGDYLREVAYALKKAGIQFRTI